MLFSVTVLAVFLIIMTFIKLHIKNSKFNDKIKKIIKFGIFILTKSSIQPYSGSGGWEEINILYNYLIWICHYSLTLEDF